MYATLAPLNLLAAECMKDSAPIISVAVISVRSAGCWTISSLWNKGQGEVPATRTCQRQHRLVQILIMQISKKTNNYHFSMCMF